MPIQNVIFQKQKKIENIEIEICLFYNQIWSITLQDTRNEYIILTLKRHSFFYILVTFVNDFI